MKVLAGIDGTERSFHALEFGCRLLSPQVDDITLYFSPPRLALKTHSEVAPDLPEMARDALAASVFAKATSRMPEAFQSLVESMVGHNRPLEGILAAADETRAELILIGAHGPSRRFPLLLGGSARKIAHRSSQPVLLVREQQPISTAGVRVLIACDDCEHWHAAAKALRNFSWPEGTEATLLHVVETMDEEHVDELAKHAHPSVPYSQNLIAEYQSNVEKQKTAKLIELQTSREGMPSIVQQATPQVAQGNIVEAIIKEVNEAQVDLVVVGARRLGRLGRLLGSTTDALLNHCPCSLLIVHEHEQP
jgi:nucleotide-binding universal stress UspA family protein